MNTYRIMQFRSTLSIIVLVSCIITAIHSATDATETWATKLGYPENKRVIILEAKEAGVCYETNAATETLFKNNHIQAASALAPCPWFKDFSKWSKQNKKYDIGLSITFVNQWKNYPWRPISPQKEVPTLIDEDGQMPSSFSQFMHNASVEDVTKEIQAQIKRARDYGVRPTFFSTTAGALFSRPDLVEAYLNISRKHWIPVIMVELTPEHIDRFRKMGVPLDQKMIDLIKSYPMPKVDDLKFAPNADSYEAKRDEFIKMLKNLSPGLTHIRIPVAVESGAIKRITKTWQQDVWNAKMLADEKVQETLKEEGIILTSWSEIMNRFEGNVEIDIDEKKTKKVTEKPVSSEKATDEKK